MPSRGKGLILNRNDLAAGIAVSVITIDTWVRDGCPYISRPKAGGEMWRFNLADVVRWREKRAALAVVGDGHRVDAEEAKRRKLTADAGLAELELAQRRRDVASVDEVGDAIESEYSIVRERLLAIPGKLAGELTPDQVDLLADEINQALEELHDASDLVEGLDTRDSEASAEEKGASAAPAPQSRRVGGSLSPGRGKDFSGTRAMADERSTGRVRPDAGGHRS